MRFLGTCVTWIKSQLPVHCTRMLQKKRKLKGLVELIWLRKLRGQDAWHTYTLGFCYCCHIWIDCPESERKVSESKKSSPTPLSPQASQYPKWRKEGVTEPWKTWSRPFRGTSGWSPSRLAVQLKTASYTFGSLSNQVWTLGQIYQFFHFSIPHWF